ncbi:hypothetical protein HY417_00245 [Candidatus Kaiserbacteria bacterium]|nr:hypothetical protein [Candidatus Kaiserbacteria bacterium]
MDIDTRHLDEMETIEGKLNAFALKRQNKPFREMALLGNPHEVHVDMIRVCEILSGHDITPPQLALFCNATNGIQPCLCEFKNGLVGPAALCYGRAILRGIDAIVRSKYGKPDP